MSLEYPLQERISSFMYRVFALMGVALLVTAFTSYYISKTPQIYTFFAKNPSTLFALLISQLILVMVLGLFIKKLPTYLVLIFFFVYSLSVGFSLSTIFLVYTQASIYSTFFVTATMFSAMALYGMFTRSDLTSIGSYGRMVLIGLVLGMLINWFLKSPMVDFVLSGIGVVLFTLLTAYDVQKLKQIGNELLSRTDDLMNKAAILGALTLYLDFINLFLFLLRFLGKRRD